MSNNEYIVIKELTRQVVQQYIMNQYPWGGILTRPLTPLALTILSITYVITIAMLVLSLVQIAVLVKYGIVSLRYVRTHSSKNSMLRIINKRRVICHSYQYLFLLRTRIS